MFKKRSLVEDKEFDEESKRHRLEVSTIRQALLLLLFFLTESFASSPLGVNGFGRLRNRERHGSHF